MKKILDLFEVCLIVVTCLLGSCTIYDEYFCPVDTKNVIVTVEYGDTLWSIAEKEFGAQNKCRTMDEFLCTIYKANENLTASIAPGQKIIIPLSQQK